MNTTYTITNNTQYNSIEISFNGKPSEEIRQALKDLRFRWHGQKRVWYGYTDEATARAAIDGKPSDQAPTKAPKAKKAEPKKNKFGVQVGDIFRATWGYEQTNNDFFQVVALCGESSVRVREVYLPMISSDPVSPMSEDRVFQNTREILPAAPHSVFIKDQEKGDIKRLKSFQRDGTRPQFFLTSYADAYFCEGDTIKVYESWYA